MLTLVYVHVCVYNRVQLSIWPGGEGGSQPEGFSPIKGPFSGKEPPPPPFLPLPLPISSLWIDGDRAFGQRSHIQREMPIPKHLQSF